MIASDAFAPALAKLRILAIHGCRFVPLKAENPHIVIGRVAGFDTAVYGLPKESFPILCELPKREQVGDVLVATTKLSHFVTGRYAPTDAWRAIWNYVFAWLQPGRGDSRVEMDRQRAAEFSRRRASARRHRAASAAAGDRLVLQLPHGGASLDDGEVRSAGERTRAGVGQSGSEARLALRPSNGADAGLEHAGRATVRWE